MSFSFFIGNELQRQRDKLEESRRILEKAPDGCLKMRERKENASEKNLHHSLDFRQKWCRTTNMQSLAKSSMYINRHPDNSVANFLQLW